MKRFIGILCTLYFVTSSLYAQTPFEQANAAYAEGRYEEAAQLYQTMIDEQPNATLYYNLGNAQFKQGASYPCLRAGTPSAAPPQGRAVQPRFCAKQDNR